MGLLRFLLTVFFIYFAFRVLSTYIFPWMVRRSVNKYKDRFYEENPHLKRDRNQKKEGQVTIHRISPEKEDKIPDDLGEYTDYEEIK